MRQEWVWCLKEQWDLPLHRQHKQPPCCHHYRPHDLPGVNLAAEYSHSRKRCADFGWRCYASKWRFLLDFGSPLWQTLSFPCVDALLFIWSGMGQNPGDILAKKVADFQLAVEDRRFGCTRLHLLQSLFSTKSLDTKQFNLHITLDLQKSHLYL